MPPDDSSLPTDLTGVATPNELAFKRAYAKSLIEGSLGIQPAPSVKGITAVSPFQAIGGLLQGYAGRKMLNDAAQQERAGNAAYGSAEAGTGPAGGPAPGGPLSAVPPPPADAHSAGYSDDVSGLMPAIARQEGTGSYSQLGPVTKTGDRAYGKYQVMGSNIGQWSREVLGYEMTPDQFLRNPGAQEQIARTKLGQYAKQYGPVGAAKAWFAGPGGMNNSNAHDQLGTTVAQYGRNVAAMMGPGGAPPAQPAAASGAGPLAFRPPAPGGVPAPNTGVPSSAGMPNPAMFPARPGMTDAQYKMIAGNPRASDADKAEARARYLEQNQPIPLAGPFGSQMIRTKDGQIFAIPGGQFQTKKVGPIEKPVPYLSYPPGFSGPAPSIQELPTAPGPQSMSAPGGPPAAAPAGGGQPMTRSVLDTASPELGKEDAKAIGGEPSTGGKESKAETPIRLASASTSDVPLTGLGKPEGPLAVKPPGAEPVAMKTAQAGGPTNDISAEDAKDLQYLQDMDVKKSYREEGNKQALDSARKFYEGVSEQAMAANQQHDQLKELDKVVNSPDFYSGFASGPVLGWKRAMAALGVSPNDSAAMETFQKMVSDTNLSSLRSTLGGLGQIRLAEINMVNNAFANRDNSVAANRALVFMKQRVNDRIAKAGQLANEYVESHGGIADQSLRNRLFNYYKDQPLMTDDEIKQFDKMISTESAAKKPAGPLSAKPPGAAAGSSATDRIQQELDRRKQQKPPEQQIPL